MSQFTKISSEIVVENPSWKYCSDRLSLPNGKESEYFYGKTADSVIVIALTDDNRLLLTQQYRYLTGSISLEFVSGQISAEESPAQAVERELKEGTGCAVSEMFHVGSFYNDNIRLTGKTFLFVSFGASPEIQVLNEEGEVVELTYRRLDEWEQMVRNGEITDSRTLSAWAIGRNHVYQFIERKSLSAN